MTLLLDATLCALVLGIALATVLGRGLFRAVVFFITHGLILSVAWVRLDAVDVALAEAAIGGGLTGVLLLTAYGRLRRMGAATEPARAGPTLPVALVSAALSGAGCAGLGVVRAAGARPPRSRARGGAAARRGRQPGDRGAAELSRLGHALGERRAAHRADRGVDALPRRGLGRAPRPAAAQPARRDHGRLRPAVAAGGISRRRSISSMRARIIPAARFRAARCWPRPGWSRCWPG